MTADGELREARIAAGMSIRELAERAEVAASTVWRIEAGRLDPTVGMMERVLRATRRAPALSSPTREAAVSLALGRLTAAHLLQDPERVLGRARRRVGAMLADPDLSPGPRRWAGEWKRLLEGALEEVVAALIDPAERGYELRQHTPFVGVIPEQDRLVAVRRASREHRATRSA